MTMYSVISPVWAIALFLKPEIFAYSRRLTASWNVSVSGTLHPTLLNSERFNAATPRHLASRSLTSPSTCALEEDKEFELNCRDTLFLYFLYVSAYAFVWKYDGILIWSFSKFPYLIIIDKHYDRFVYQHSNY